MTDRIVNGVPRWGGAPLYVVTKGRGLRRDATGDLSSIVVGLMDVARVTHFVLNKAGGGWTEEQTAKAMEQMSAIHRGETYRVPMIAGGDITIDVLQR